MRLHQGDYDDGRRAGGRAGRARAAVRRGGCGPHPPRRPRRRALRPRPPRARRARSPRPRRPAAAPGLRRDPLARGRERAARRRRRPRRRRHRGVPATRRRGSRRSASGSSSRSTSATAQVRTAGWTEGAGLSLDEAVARCLAAGVTRVLCTAIDRDGTLAGPDLELVRTRRRLGPPRARGRRRALAGGRRRARRGGRRGRRRRPRAPVAQVGATGTRARPGSRRASRGTRPLRSRR